MANEFADVIRLYLSANKADGKALVKDGQYFYSKLDNKLYLKENDTTVYELPEQAEITSQITAALAAKTDLTYDANNYIEIQSNRFDVYVAGDLVFTAQSAAAQVRMYNFLLDSYVGLDNSEAQMNAGGTAWVKASKTTGLVTNSNEAADYAGANDDLSITKGILEAEAGTLTGPVTQWRNGYDGAEDPLYKYDISLAWDSINRRVTVSNSVTGTVKFWTNDTFYEHTNGDTKLYADLPDENNSFFLYFNASGQLTWVRDSAVTNEALLYCIVAKMVYDSDAGNEILAIKELHDAFEPIGLRGRLHNTTGTVWSSGAVLSLATVGSDAVSITAGVAYDEDVKINMAAQTQTGAVYPKYYFDGKNASSLDRIKRGSVSNKIALFDTEISLGVTGRPVYNLNTAGTWSPQILGTNDYMCMHMFGANGADFVANIDYTIAIGQASYNSVSDARAAIEDEAANLQLGAAAIREAVLLYSFIIDDTGSIVAVDGSGNTFIDWRAQKAGSSGGSAVLQDLASVLTTGNDAGALKITNLANGTAAQDAATFGQAIQDIEEVLISGSDANGQGIENLGDTDINGTTNHGSLLYEATDEASSFGYIAYGVKRSGTSWIATQNTVVPTVSVLSSGSCSWSIDSGVPANIGDTVLFTNDEYFNISSNNFKVSKHFEISYNTAGAAASVQAANASGFSGFEYKDSSGNTDAYAGLDTTGKFRINSTSNLGLDVIVGGSVQFEVDSNGKTIIHNDVININASKTPASASATGVAGDVAWDSNYIYVCVATNTWKRAALSTW